VSGKIVSVIDGRTFVVDLDLGWNVHHYATLRATNYDCPADGLPGWLEAKKVAQRLLPPGATVVVKTTGESWGYAEIEYAPYWQPVSEEGSLRTAMIASGHARDRSL